MAAIKHTVEDKILRAKIQLIMSQPFFATLMLSMRVVEDTTIKKAATNGVEIKLNPDYVDTLTVEEVKTVLCEAIMEVANLHCLRRNGRDKNTWNKACEYAVTPILRDAGFKIVKGMLSDKAYDGMPAEQIFKLMPGEVPDDSKGKGSSNGQGDDKQGQGAGGDVTVEVQDSPAETISEQAEEEARIKQKVAMAAQIGKRAGKIPGGLQEMINEILEPKVSWKEVVSRFVHEIAKSDYSYRMPNKRYMQQGIYLPSLYSEEPGRIIVIVDTSISIKSVIGLFEQFAGEMQDLCNEIKAPLTIMHVDTMVQFVEEVEPDDKMSFVPRGLGGTDFAPGFEYIEEHGIEAKAIIYFTDGECHSYPDREPDMPVLWAKFGNYKGFKPPFGEIIKVDN